MDYRSKKLLPCELTFEQKYLQTDLLFVPSKSFERMAKMDLAWFHSQTSTQQQTENK